ncbi:MAG: hypothetical protein EHM49_10320, partial [Deltaproteobacteria bacterium]
MLFIIISIFIALYGVLHYYVYKKIIIVVPFGHWSIIIILGCLIFTPFLVALLTNAGYTALATPLAWVGYSWMGVVFLFFSFSVVLDFYSLITKAGGRLLGVQVSALMLPSPYYSVFMATVLTFMATCYGFFAARQINVEWIHIPTSKLDRMFDSFRIVQISDLHLGLLSDEMRLRRLIETIRSVQPDVVVSTGDL